jgi:hypothetical protein
MTRWTLASVSALLLLAPPQEARAQSTRAPLSQLLPSLVTTAATLAVPNPQDPGQSFVPPLTPRPGDNNTFNFVNALPNNPNPAALNNALGLQVAAFPTVTVWTGVPGDAVGSGTPDLRSMPSGSSFAERATTLGARRFTLGFGHQGTTFDAMDGLGLDNGLKMYFEYADCCPGNSPLSPEIERDLLEQTLQVDVHRDVYGFVANYGLSDRVDVGALVPFVKVNLDGRIHARILRTATASNPQLNRFDLLELQSKTVYASASAHGLGDIQLHGKVRLVEAAGGGLALTGGVRFPTGDEQEWLGTGQFGGRVGAVWSSVAGRFGPHVSAAYSRYGGGASERPPDEIFVLGGTDIGIVRRFVVSTEVVYRQLMDAPRAERVATTFANRGPGPLPSASLTVDDNLRVGGSESLQQVLAVVGGKLLVMGNWVLHSDVVLPMKDDGVTPRFSFVAGLNYTF